MKTDPFSYIFEYSPEFLKTRVIDICNTDKKCFIKIIVELSPRDIGFLEIKGSPSLVKIENVRMVHFIYSTTLFKDSL